MKWCKALLLSLLTCCMGICIWYFRPIQRHIDMEICTKDGVTAQIVGDISLSRRILKPTVFSGELMVNGVLYIDEQTKFRMDYNGLGSDIVEWPLKLKENLQLKQNDIIVGGRLYQADASTYTAFLEPIILIDLSENNDYTAVCVIKITATPEGTETQMYWGPAAAPEEARQIEEIH